MLPSYQVWTPYYNSKYNVIPYSCERATHQWKSANSQLLAQYPEFHSNTHPVTKFCVANWVYSWSFQKHTASSVILKHIWSKKLNLCCTPLNVITGDLHSCSCKVHHIHGGYVIVQSVVFYQDLNFKGGWLCYTILLWKSNPPMKECRLPTFGSISWISLKHPPTLSPSFVWLTECTHEVSRSTQPQVLFSSISEVRNLICVVLHWMLLQVACIVALAKYTTFMVGML